MASVTGNDMVMPVQPMSNSYGYPMPNFGGGLFGSGDSGLWILFLIALCNGGFGGWGMGGFGGMMGMGMADGMMLYPWLNNSQNINDGFREQMLNTTVNGIQNSITSGFGDVQLGIAGINQNICQTGSAIQNSMCQGFNSVTGAVTGAQNALAQQMYNNQIADMERSYNAQAAQTSGMNSLAMGLQNCCCENRQATADLKYTVAAENCATRTADAQNTRDIIDSQNRGTQAILDKLCALELDNVKSQLAQAQRENVGLQNAVNMATMQASQTAQTAQILAGQAAEIDGVYNRLKNCPVPSMPVYGNTPIFTCGGNNYGYGCAA